MPKKWVVKVSETVSTIREYIVEADTSGEAIQKASIGETEFESDLKTGEVVTREILEDPEEVLDINVPRNPFDLIQKRIEGKYVIFAAYETDEDGHIIDNLDEVPVKGSIQFVCGQYVSPFFVNPTWLQIAKLADEMIGVTQDFHHVFLEGIRFLARNNEGSTFAFSMGS